MRMQRRIVMQLPVELLDQLDRLASACDVPRAALIRAAIDDLVSDAAEHGLDQRIVARLAKETPTPALEDGSVSSSGEETW
jgi:metal-responsive CopG/Arc/MetJ family transcriptional regulator